MDIQIKGRARVGDKDIMEWTVIALVVSIGVIIWLIVQCS